MVNNKLFSASYDKFIVGWDYTTLDTKIQEKKQMKIQDIESRRIEVYNKAVGGRKATKKSGSNKQKIGRRRN